MRVVGKWLMGVLCLAGLAWGAASVRGDTASTAPATQTKDLYTELYLRDGKSAPVRGTVARSTEAEVVIKTAKGEVTLLWTDVTGSSAYVLRSRMIDKNSPKAWLDLGTFAWGVNAREEARTAFDRAAALDRTCRAQGDAVLRTAPGVLLKPVVVPGVGDDPAAGRVATGGAPPTTGTLPGELFEGVKGIDFGTPTKFVTFGKSSPGQNAAVLAASRKLFGQIAARLKFKTSEFQTDHFVVFSDARVGEQEFITKAAEDAYAAVTARFDVPADQGLFLGKLPVFVFSKAETLQNVALNEDNMAIPDDLPGCWVGGADGHLSMGPPAMLAKGTVNADGARQIWSHVLKRELTPAFLARWRSNRPWPAWLARGTAEVIAAGELNSGAQEAAQAVAAKHASIQSLFSDATPEGEWFPVMQTLAEFLITRDGKAFVEMGKALKDGVAPAEALKAQYKMDYAGLEKAWREAIQKKAE